MIDTNTKNKSFKEMRNILYDHNIKNPDFMLELKDESLIDLPENPILWDATTRKKVVAECKNNFWFFVREIVRIPSDDIITYKDSYEYCKRFRLRIDTLRLFYAYINNITIMYRTINESSMNEAIAILMVYEYIVKDKYFCPNYDTNVPKQILNIINNIISLNEYTLFLDNLGSKNIFKNKSSNRSVNKFIFDVLNLYVGDNDVIDADNKIISLDKAYQNDNRIGLSLYTFIKDTFKPYNDTFGLFNMNFPKDAIEGANLYIEPIYKI